MKSGIIVLALALAAAAPAGAQTQEENPMQFCSVVEWCGAVKDIQDAAAVGAPGDKWDIHNYRVGLPDHFNGHFVGERDLTHGDWLTGVGVDVFWLKRVDEDHPIAYLLVKQMFDIDRAWTGSFGVSLGINTGKAGETLARIAGVVAPDQAKRLKWVRDAANWVSIEGGWGYRAAGIADGQRRDYWSIGGKVRVPIEKLWAKK